MDLLAILQNLDVLPVHSYGSMILFSDIVAACKALGFNNRDILEQLLLQLEKENKLEVVYMEDEELIIGVRLL